MRWGAKTLKKAGIEMRYLITTTLSAFQQHLNSRRPRLLDLKAGLLAYRQALLDLPASFGAEAVVIQKINQLTVAGTAPDFSPKLSGKSPDSLFTPTIIGAPLNLTLKKTAWAFIVNEYFSTFCRSC